MIISLPKLNIFLTICFIVGALPLYTNAHGVGASIEEVVDGYLIDIGYSPATIVANNQTRLDFLLFVEETNEEIEYDDVWLRIEDEERLLFAGAVSRSEYGATGVSFSFPEAKNYNIFVRYNDEEGGIVEHEVTLPVNPEEKVWHEEMLPVWLVMIGLAVAVTLGVAVTLFFILRRQSSTILVSAKAKSIDYQSIINRMKNFLQPILIIMITAGLTFFVATWYIGLDDRESSVKIESPQVAGDVVEVVLTESGYEPREITIPVGTTVRFSTTVNRPFWPASNLHPSHEIYSEFDPREPIPSDGSWSFTFNRVGVWNMHDHIRSYFTGSITVTE